MVPDEFGVRDASTHSRSMYTRTKFVADLFSIQIKDVDFKNSGPGGPGIYEAVCITKTQSVTEAAKEHGVIGTVSRNKDYNVNLPSRLLGVLKSALEFIYEERCANTLQKCE